MLKSFKYRLYPTDSQKIFLAKHFGCRRFIYNWGLEKKIKKYAENKGKISCFELSRELPSLKKDSATSWLKEVNAQVLQAALGNLDDAYSKFFQGAGFPKFKSKNRSRDSFLVPQSVELDTELSLLYIPKFREGIKIKLDRLFEGEIRNATVSKDRDNKYYVSILVEDGKELPAKAEIREATTVGVDLGITHFIILSDGTKVVNPKYYRSHEKALAKHQRRFSRKEKGSKRREKQRIRLAKMHKKIFNCRKDFHHKISTDLIRRFDTVITENLNVEGMVKNHNLAKSINDCGWSSFCNMLKYKADWYGKNYLTIGRFEPSSKVCSSCGAIKKDLTLKDREWTCSECSTIHDRDINAAINVKRFGLQG